MLSTSTFTGKFPLYVGPLSGADEVEQLVSNDQRLSEGTVRSPYRALGRFGPELCDRDRWSASGLISLRGQIRHALEEPDLAPKFYPVLSSLRSLDLPDWAVVATGAGAEPSA